MGAVDSILGIIAVGGELRVHEFLGPRRVGAARGADHGHDWWRAAQSDYGSGLRVWLLNVRAAANDVLSSSVNSPTVTRGGVIVSSSRSGAVSAEAVSGGTRTRSASFQVKVTNLAVAQVNEGGALTSSETNAVQAGTNTFTIKVGTGAATTVAFTNDSTDTYARALEKLAATINDAHAGTSASVVEDKDNGTVRLVLSADATGLGNAFTVGDVSGNVVSTVGLGSSTTAAENAKFFVNGVPKTSGSNTVLIDRGRVELTLKGATGPTGDDDEPGALISVKPDPLAEAVLRLTSSLNSLGVLVQTDGSAHARRIQGTFAELLTKNEANLDGIGISIAQNGQLRVDCARLETAIGSSRSVETALLGGVSALVAELSAAATTALEGSQIRAQHGELARSDALPFGSPVVAPHRGASPGVFVDIFG